MTSPDNLKKNKKPRKVFGGQAGIHCNYGGQSVQRNMAEENLLRHKLSDLDLQRRKSIQAISGQEIQILRDLQRRESSGRHDAAKGINSVQDRKVGHQAIHSTSSSTSSSRRGSQHSVDLDFADSSLMMQGGARHRRHSLDMSSLRSREITSAQALDDVFAPDSSSGWSSRQQKVSPLCAPQTQHQHIVSTKSRLQSLDSKLNNHRVLGPDCKLNTDHVVNLDSKLNNDRVKVNNKSVSFDGTLPTVTSKKHDISRHCGRGKLAPISRADGCQNITETDESPHLMHRRSYQIQAGVNYNGKKSPFSNTSPGQFLGTGNKIQGNLTTKGNSESLTSLSRAKTAPGPLSSEFKQSAMNQVKLDILHTDQPNFAEDPLCSEAVRNRLKFLHGDSAAIGVAHYKTSGHQHNVDATTNNASSDQSRVSCGLLSRGSERGAMSAVTFPKKRFVDTDRVLARLTGETHPGDTRAQWEDLGKYLGEFRKQHNLSQHNHPSAKFPDKLKADSSDYDDSLDDKLLPRRHSETNFLLLADAVKRGHSFRAKFRNSKNRPTSRSTDHPCGSAEYRQRNTSVKKLATMHSVLQSSALSMADPDPEMF